MVEILESYCGLNPFILFLKQQIFKRDLTPFEEEYVLTNINYSGYRFKSVVKLNVGSKNVEYLNKQFGTEKQFEQISVEVLIGETSSIYHFGFKQKSFFVYKDDCENPIKKEITSVEFDPTPYDTNNNWGRKLYPHQIDGVKFMMLQNPAFCWDDVGLGKMAAYDSKVLTPNGWVEMRNINAGSQVIGSKGQAINVLQVYPQPVKEMYNIHFTDGAVVEVCGEHLWAVQNDNDRRRSGKYRVKSTLQLKEDLSKPQYKKKKWFIPVVEPVQFNPQDINVHPYLMGCLLGDGYLGGGTMKITSADQELLIHLSKILPIDNKIKQKSAIEYSFVSNSRVNNLTRYIKEYGLFKKTSGDKFIPDAYKFNTIENRIALLQGLLDTDGYCTKDGTIQFYTVSEQLCIDFKELIRSLGGIVKQTIKKGKYKKHDTIIACKDCYVLTVNLPQNIIPFKLSRKLNRIKKVKKYIPYRAISDISFSRYSDGQCIRVDAKDSLYVMGEYVVTHNTAQSIVAALASGYKNILVVTLASLKLNWRREIENYRNTVKIISGSEWDETKTTFTIINYEILKNFVVSKKAKNKQVSTNHLLKQQFDCIILDEIHRAKNPQSIQSNCINLICSQSSVKKVIGLSGTPFERNIDFYNICRTINRNVTDVVLANGWIQDVIENHREYALRYCNAYEQVLDNPKTKREKAEILELLSDEVKKFSRVKGVLNVIQQHGVRIGKIKDWQIGVDGVPVLATNLTVKDCQWLLKQGFEDRRKKVIVLGRKVGDVKIENSNTEELYLRIRHTQIIRKKTDILEYFPSKIIFPLYFELSANEKLEYRELWEEYLAEKNMNGGNLTQEDLQKISQSVKMRQFLAQLKCSHTCNFVENKIEEGLKVIIFTHFKEEYEYFVKYFGKLSVGIHATMAAEKKQSLIDKFQTDENIKVIVGNIRTLGTGHNITKGDVAIINSPDWNSGEHEQAEGRSWRIGRTEDVTVYYCLFENTHEEEVFERSKQKKDNKDIILQT
jgi:superfamily II DNA or RNA helicase